MEINARLIAEVIHGATRGLKRPCGTPIPEWSLLSEQDQDLATRAVVELLNKPPMQIEAYHQLWADLKIEDGWVFGSDYCPTQKTHPSLVPFDKLSEAEQIKDKIWASLIELFRPHVKEAL